ncbi:TPA: hypothetical protein ACH3X1_016007 [Trebouxia sp. C0004]
MGTCSTYSTGQGRIACLLFSAALQIRLTAATCVTAITPGDLLNIQAVICGHDEVRESHLEHICDLVRHLELTQPLAEAQATDGSWIC